MLLVTYAIRLVNTLRQCKKRQKYFFLSYIRCVLLKLFNSIEEESLMSDAAAKILMVHMDTTAEYHPAESGGGVVARLAIGAQGRDIRGAGQTKEEALDKMFAEIIAMDNDLTFSLTRYLFETNIPSSFYSTLTLNEYEELVYSEFEQTGDYTRSDAQGIVMMNEDKMAVAHREERAPIEFFAEITGINSLYDSTIRDGLSNDNTTSIKR